MKQLFKGHAVMICAAALLSACTTLDQVVQAPQVSLRYVQLKEFDISKQTFVLGFDVTNPNALSLPVKFVNYGVQLGGTRFASGETVSAFTIPAQSDTEFAITADLDLLNTAPQLMSLLRSSANGNLDYALEGSLGIDLPFVQPVPFASSGQIQVTSGLF